MGLCHKNSSINKDSQLLQEVTKVFPDRLRNIVSSVSWVRLNAFSWLDVLETPTMLPGHLIKVPPGYHFKWLYSKSLPVDRTSHPLSKRESSHEDPWSQIWRCSFSSSLLHMWKWIAPVQDEDHSWMKPKRTTSSAKSRVVIPRSTNAPPLILGCAYKLCP